MKRTLSAFVVALLLAAMAMPAFAEKRIALVIGNGAYKTSTTLKNPPNDAADVSAALKSVGFTVTTLVDGKREAMEKAVRDFGNALKDPDAVGLFYYSGHGAQVDGANYLLPVDADIQAEDELAYKAVNAEQVLAKMRSAGNRLNIVVMDACRNNPFPGSTRSADKGLAVVRVKVPESIIVYATDPGAVAQDGDGRNSPFTTAFIAQLTVPGQEISVALRRVTGEVKVVTGGSQTPWVSTNYTSDFAFRAGSASTSAPPPATPSKTPSFGAVAAATGNLSIQLAYPGTVSVAGLSAAVPAGTVPVNDLAAGSQTITVRYADGKSESLTVTVPVGGTVSVSFTYTPPAPTPASAAAQTTGSGTTGAKADASSPSRTYRNEVWVEGGIFRMGSDSGSRDEKPVHTVILSGFWIMNTEVTQGDYRALMGTNPSYLKGDSLPVEWVSWYDSVAYANKLSQKDGLIPAYTIINGTNVTWNKGANGWRLPTEAEWEYAALGGPKASGLATSTVYAGSSDAGSVAWYKGNSGNKTHQVATKAPNVLGLYDMAGNAAEWTNDWYDSYSSDGQTDPSGASAGAVIAVRGGEFNNEALHVRSSARDTYPPSAHLFALGFRLVRRP